MKKKLIALVIVAALALVAVPAAFAAGSLPDSQSASGDTYSAQLVGSNENINNLVVVPDGSLTWDVSFTDGTTSNFGTLTLTFNVGTEYNGQTATIKVTHSDGTVDTTTQVVNNGVVSVTLTKLSTVSITFSGTSTSSSSSASSTSPKTGADTTLIAIISGAALIGAAGVFMLRKREQN